MKSFFREFFSFTKKELNGLLVLCFILFFIAVSPFLDAWLHPPESYDYSMFEKDILAFKASALQKENKYPFAFPSDREKKIKEIEYFVFDPNHLSESSWRKLGLSMRQIEIIRNYESKGGHFYKKEDLRKIYSISASDYERLAPYISISSQRERMGRERATWIKKKRLSESVDINVADSAHLEQLKGIGPAFAARIVKYRNRLGGFYHIDQLMEVYGMDSLRFKLLQDQISLNAEAIQKININTASFDDLRRFPYLSYKQMNSIIQYRRQHGPYTAPSDLRQLPILTEETLKKILPYLSF